MEASLAWLEDPEVFAVNKIPAHSDHKYYQSYEEAATKQVNYPSLKWEACSSQPYGQWS